MRGVWIVYGLALIWLALFALSFGMFAVTEPTDFGFTRGMNRLGVLFGWQAAALIAAVAALVATLRLSKPRPLAARIVGYGPLSLMLLQLVAVVGVALVFHYSDRWGRHIEPPPAAAPAEPATAAI
ncbi:MAG: hypothetical protein GC201_05955 [Alphaproteobacteria bacterium]|nr:hypothetical protein [Alphaproteobacteria bacterium]